MEVSENSPIREIWSDDGKSILGYKVEGLEGTFLTLEKARYAFARWSEENEKIREGENAKRSGQKI